MRKILIAIGIVISSTVFAQNSIPVYLDETKDIDERVENALSLMTLEEKVALCHAQSKFSSAGVKRLGIPELWMSDGPHGIREEILWDSWDKSGWTTDSCTAFPALTCLAASFDPELAYIYGKAIGEEARYRKKDVLLGPGVNIYRTPLNGRNFEYMGEDPYLASVMAVPYIHGVQQNGVAACVKHYALNNQEHWRMDVDISVSYRALHEIYLPAFKASVIEGKTWSIMGAYNKFRGEYCCHNDLLLNKILKKDWEFDGVVISDWGGTHNTYQAINNGLDLEMGTYTDGLSTTENFSYDRYHLANPFLKALCSGEVSEEILNDKARRVLRLIFRTSMNRQKPWGSFNSPEHFSIARRIAEEGIVLLKNDRNILPLDVRKQQNILVVGENAVKKMTLGGGSSELKALYEVSPLNGIQKAFSSNNIEYAEGYSSDENANKVLLLQEAVNKAKNADVVIFFGGLNKDLYQDCEGEDRKQFHLPYNQDALIDALTGVNKNIVVVMISGNAVEMPWVNKANAILQAWYSGSEAGNAIANVITGKVNPSGKLPFSFPVKLSDCSAHASGNELSYPGIDKKVEYRDDILVGYRWYDTKKIEPLFPFGYGLSYTTFEYGKPIVNKNTLEKDETVSIEISVKNTEKVAGAEVLQFYVSDVKSSVLRPEKELKAFKKVFLNPGETKKIHVELPVIEWAFYDEKTSDWIVESGDFLIQIGNSSRNIAYKLKCKIR